MKENHTLQKRAALRVLRVELAIFVGVAIALIYTALSAIRDQQLLAGQVLRLHVVAQSDSAEDQALKLMVRDRLLAMCADVPETVGTAAEARAWTEAQLPVICAAAEAVLAEQGCPHTVRAEITEEAFPTRSYGTFALPAGNYTALKVTIGEGKGQNWWCVMFPPLCTAAAAEREAAAVFTDGQWHTITAQTPDVAIRFRILEWWQALKSLF